MCDNKISLSVHHIHTHVHTHTHLYEYGESEEDNSLKEQVDEDESNAGSLNVQGIINKVQVRIVSTEPGRKMKWCT